MKGFNKIYIGIDGGHNIGFAVWDKTKKELSEVKTLSFWEAINAIDHYRNRDKYEKVIVKVEDVSQNKPIFKLAKVYQKTKGNHFIKLAAAGKVAEGVGRVKENSDLLIQYCEFNGIEVMKSRPGKKSATKMEADQFQKITGYKKRTSKHARDAAMMVYGI